MYGILRLLCYAGFGALLLVPHLATQASLDAIVPERNMAGSLSPRNAAMANEILSRLRDVKREIRSERCGRADRNYCFSGLCLLPPGACTQGAAMSRLAP